MCMDSFPPKAEQWTKRKMKRRMMINLFDCHEPGCGKSFDTLSELAKQFSTITNLKPNKGKAKHEELLFGGSSELFEGWTLATSSGNVRFAENLKSY